jgi:hypothetical protein
MTEEYRNKLDEFMHTADPEEIGRVARVAETTPNYLYHLARQYGAGRCPNVKMALGIDTATREIRKTNGGRTPHVTVQDVGAICGFEKADA